MHLHSVVFCLHPYCMIILSVDNLFFYLGSQSVSCKVSLAALHWMAIFVIFVLCLYRKINMMMMMNSHVRTGGRGGTNCRGFRCWPTVIVRSEGACAMRAMASFRACLKAIFLSTEFAGLFSSFHCGHDAAARSPLQLTQSSICWQSGWSWPASPHLAHLLTLAVCFAVVILWYLSVETGQRVCDIPINWNTK